MGRPARSPSLVAALAAFHASLQATEAVVTPNLFDVLGVHPSMGRPFDLTPEKRGPLVGREVIVSHAFWQRALGGDAGAIGRPIRIEGAAGSVIVGVMPAGFSFPEGTDFWTPMDAGRAGSERRDSRLYGAIGRLAPKVSLATARAQLQSIAAALAREHPDTLARLPDPRAAVPRQGAVIVNETTARIFWPGENAIGQYLSTSFDARPVSRRQVVGIVRDARSESIRGLPPAEVYVPYLEDPSFAMTLLVRSVLPADQVVSLVRRELREVSVDLSTANVRMLDEVVGDSIRSSRFSALVIGAFAAAALTLSALGVFGVFAGGAASRVREVGIRMALGATGREIARMFLRQAAGPIVVGLVLGSASAFALGRVVESLLFGVTPADLVSYATATSALVAIALFASYLPIRRVLRADPAQALRE